LDIQKLSIRNGEQDREREGNIGLVTSTANRIGKEISIPYREHTSSYECEQAE